MRMTNLHATGFSLLEILMAAIIFTIAVAGVFATLNAVRAPVNNKENELTAASFGKEELEALRTQVSAAPSANYYTDPNCSNGICTDFSLSLGTHHTSGSGQIIFPINYYGNNPNGVTYTVYCANTGSTTICGPDMARRVDLTVNY